MSNITNSNQNKTIVCFYYHQKKVKRFFADINDFSIIYKDDLSTNGIKFLKSKVNYEKNKSLICFGFANSNINCTIYSIENDSFSEFIEYEVYCKEDRYCSKFEYIQQIDLFLFYCSDHQKITLAAFDNDFKYISQNNNTNILSENNIKNFAILYLANSNNYILIYEINGFQIKNLSIYINNENKTSEIETTIHSIYSHVSSTIISTYNPNIEIISNSQISSLNTHSTEEYTSSIEIDNTNLLTSNIQKTSIIDYISYSLPITSNEISPSTQNIIEEKKIDIKKENLIDELDSIIDGIDKGKIYKKVGEDYSILIYPTNSSYLTSTTHVNFSQCESILRTTKQIPDSSVITFLQIELENEDSKSLINQVEYKAYDENFTQLDLSLCGDATIQVFYAIKNDTPIDFDSVDSFKDLGVDIFNINDSFFNDICEPYSESDNDLILEDRIKDIYQNYSLCEEGCTYNEIDLENKIISCDCKVKSSVSTDVTSLNLEEAEGSSTNFDVIKCYNLVFSLEGKLNNIGFWLIGLLVLTHFPILFYYFKKGVKPVKDYILKEMENYGYIKESKNTNNHKIKNSENKKPKRSPKHRKLKNNNAVNAAPPPKHKKAEKFENQRNHIAKDLKLIDNSSSLNAIKSTKREIFPKTKDDMTKTEIIDKKFSNDDHNKILHKKKSSKKILLKKEKVNDNIFNIIFKCRI